MTKRSLKLNVSSSKTTAFNYFPSIGLYAENPKGELGIFDSRGRFVVLLDTDNNPRMPRLELVRSGAEARLIISGWRNSPLVLAGELARLGPAPTLNWRQLLRRYPQLVRPNYVSSAIDTTTWAYGLADNFISAKLAAGKIEISLSSLKPHHSIWQAIPLSTTEIFSKVDYLINAYLLTAQSWQDPRPWLELVDRFGSRLRRQFKHLVYQKLLNQFALETSNQSTIAQTSGFNDLANLVAQAQTLSQHWQIEVLKRAVPAWWQVHAEALLLLALGAEVARSPAERRHFRPVFKFIQDCLAQGRPLAFAHDLSWWQGFMLQESSYFAKPAPPPMSLFKRYQQVQRRYFPEFNEPLPSSFQIPTYPSRPTPKPAPSGRWPLSIAECLNLLYSSDS